LHLFLYRVSLAGTTIVEAHSFGNSDSAGFTPPMKAYLAELQSLGATLATGRSQ